MVTVTGEDAVGQTGSADYIWHQGSADIDVTYTINGSTNHTRVCLIPETPSATGTCQPATAGAGFQHTTFSGVRVPAGETTFRVTLVRDRTTDNTEPTGVLAANSLTVTAIEPGGDLDGDGLQNQEEIAHHTFVHETDTDTDGLQDGPEIHEYDTNPLTADTDDDGLRDAVEINRGLNPTKADTDADGLADGNELDRGTDPTSRDTDGDGLADGDEVSLGTDPTAVDTDADGFDDAFETRLGTDPASGWSPLGWVALVGVAALVIGYRYGTRRSDETPTTDEKPAGPDSPARTMQPPHPNTDRGQVLALLAENGGTLPQRDIVAETAWSKAKVSRLLTRLEHNGDITKLHRGRENLICLPDVDLDESNRRRHR